MAKGFWKKAFGPLGVKPTEIDGEEYYEEMEETVEDLDYDAEEEQQEPQYAEPSFSARRRSKVIAMPEGRSLGNGSVQMKMIIFRPTSYDETQVVIDSLKSRKPIVVNLDEIDVAVAQRILDFISGAVYALGGDIKKAARNIFVVAPSNVEITTNIHGAGGAVDEDAYSMPDML